MFIRLKLILVYITKNIRLSKVLLFIASITVLPILYYNFANQLKFNIKNKAMKRT